MRVSGTQLSLDRVREHVRESFGVGALINGTEAEARYLVRVTMFPSVESRIRLSRRRDKFPALKASWNRQLFGKSCTS